MAYTGSGTQADPYLVSTWDDFLTCAGKSNKYVKIISDIDCGQAEYTSYISVKAKEIYADDLVTISGFTVSSNYFLQYTGSTKCTFRNICINAAFNPSSGTMIMGSTTAHLLFQHCKILINVSAPPKCKLFVNSDFTDCDIRVSYNGAFWAYPNLIAQECVFRCCIIEITNYHSTNPVILLDSGTVSVQYCTFKFSASVKTVKNSGDWYLFGANGSTFHSLYIMTLSYDSIISDTLTKTKIYGTNMLADMSVKGKFDISFDNDSGNYLLTTAQMKSEAFLEQIGFITEEEEVTWIFDNYFYGYPHASTFTETENPLKLMFGGEPVPKAYLGSELVWETGGINKIILGRV